MFNKRFLQIILLIAVLVASLGITSNAFAYTCGTSYTVQSGNTLGSIAKACGTSVAALKLANPGLGQYIYAGQVLTLPGAYWDNGNGYATYVVARGDTLKALATRFGTTMDVLGSLNGLTNYNLIYEGQRLTVPSGSAVPVPPPPTSGTIYTIQQGDTLRKIATRINSTVSDILAVNPQITNANLIYVGQIINLPASASYYTVQSGDTMKKIAARFGTTLDSLTALNLQIKDVNIIYVGQVVRVS
ncbi:MAG: LysM peptidoglycan-binding domain-containing protein [Anaerolineales bacterium]|nr:LysM peptidoglycan-binding domain-containing protein [Anaerolineales bacterium]